MSIAGTTLTLLAGCEERLSAVHPAGPVADAIATLWWVMLVGATCIFLMVMLLLVLAFRRGPASHAPEAEQKREKVWILGLGIGFSLVVLAALTAYGLVLGERFLPREGPEVVTVHAQGRQWEWSFRYADLPGVVTQGVLHIPAGQPINVEITTADVIHSFWVPQLAGKLDAIPGYVNVLRIEAWRPGEYAGVSAEYNGPGYTSHVFTVRAHDKAGWAAFLMQGRQA